MPELIATAFRTVRGARGQSTRRDVPPALELEEELARAEADFERGDFIELSHFSGTPESALRRRPEPEPGFAA
jgi:hypothetical protein